MPSSLFNAGFHTANKSAIVATTSVGVQSDIINADGTIWVETGDISVVSANYYTIPDFLPDESEADYLTRNGAAILAARADTVTGAIDGILYPRYSEDLLLCKKIEGYPA